MSSEHIIWFWFHSSEILNCPPGRMVKNELVTKIYPLHDSDKLKAMELEWYGSIIGSQVITNVRDYFGKSFN